MADRRFSTWYEVAHKDERWKGWMIGTTTNRKLFTGATAATDTEQYRVLVGDRVRVAAQSALLGTGRCEERQVAAASSQPVTCCYECHETIDREEADRCPTCRWSVCEECAACGCGYPEKK